MKKVSEIDLFSIILTVWVIFVTILPVICIIKITTMEEKIGQLEDIVFINDVYVERATKIKKDIYKKGGQ